ncbi:MAG: protein TolR [Deltaproteobacteria bacterium]|jgi:biopolymer transport protein TolR|nr:MAG: protein TolR [Deltaproteobacteria bacterium]
MAGFDSHRSGASSIAQINVTPLVDVMLVLLVIFMVTAPIIQQGVAVDLPKTRAAPLNAQEEPLVVGIAQNGAIYLNDVPIAIGDLRGKLVAVAQAKPDHQVLLRADRNVPYGEVVRVIAAVKEAGVSRLGMVTEPPPEGR